MVRLAAVQTSIDAKEYAELFVRENFAKHGLPKSIVSDRDPRFTSEFFSQLCELLHIKQRMSTAYRPQTDGQTERMNRTLEEMLRAFVSPRCDDWDTFLPCCEFAMNNAWNESIRTTPFFLNYGRHPRSRSDFVFDKSEYQSADYAQSIQSAVKDAQQNMSRAQVRQTKYANKKRRELSFEGGEYVLLDGKNLAGHQKLGNRFVGPYKIVKRVGPVSYELALTADMKMHDVFHVSRLRPYKRRLGMVGAPSAIMPSGETEVEVEEILDHMDDGDNVRWYEVRYADRAISWIPERDPTDCRERVKEYFSKRGMSCAERPPRLGRRNQIRIKEKQIRRRRVPPKGKEKLLPLNDSA